MAITTDRVSETLARIQQILDAQVHHYQTEQERGGSTSEAAVPLLSIALSRQAGSGGAAVARAVGERLGWPVYDHELLDRIAQEKGLNARLLEHLDERTSGWLENTIRNFSGAGGDEERIYLRALLGLLAGLGKAGHCVIVGRGAAQMLPAASTLRVRVIAPRESRVAEVQKRRRLSRAEAERWVDTTDRARNRFVKQSFQLDSDDPLLYDLVLNSDRLGVEKCAALIVQVAELLEQHAAAAKMQAV
jgi:cytidylate kinase